MTTRTLLPAVLGLALLASATLPPTHRSIENQLKESEHKKVGEKIASCIEADIERNGKKRDAEDDLSSYLDKKWTKAAKKRSPLVLSDDIAAALWYVTDYTKIKGLKKGRITEMPVSIDYYGEGFTSTAAVWLPKKYSPKIQYPLVFCIPEPGIKPEAHLNDSWADSTVREGAILVAIEMPEDEANWGSPGDEGVPGGFGILMRTFRQVQDTYAIDFDRVFLAGQGLGVQAAMQIANLSADRFAGIIGRSGDAAEMAPNNLSNIPCFFAGGGKRVSAYAEQAKEVGGADCLVKADGKLTDVWSWMAEVKRNANPETVLLLPTGPTPTKAYWLEIVREDYPEGSKLKATADRASNTITIDANNIESVTIYLNDSIVDLDNPVKVILNGVEHEDMIPRNFNTMIQQIYKGRSDPGKLYTTRTEYDIPKPASDDSEGMAQKPK